ncbi:MAG: TlyA family RNA methyltransferase [Ruminiclostridium sp.]
MSKRIDVAMAERGLVKSRTLAQNLIKEGNVHINGRICTKASEMVEDTDNIEITGEMPKYVSRGGLKLEKAVSLWEIDLDGAVCLDVGASTGGFTDCMLQKGAKKVYAVDVGTSQLDPKLRADSRVISLENTDIRKARIPEKADFISIDVSFISLKLILPYIKALWSEKGRCVALIKPQFEAGKKYLGKNGVIKDKKLQQSIVEDIKQFCITSGFTVMGTTESAITGGDGNREFLIYLSN